MRFLVLATIGVLLGASCSGGSSAPNGTVAATTDTPAQQKVDEPVAAVAGIAFDLPGGWSVRRHGAGFVNPALCFEASSSPRSGVVELARSSATSTSVELRVVELQDTEPGLDTRPAVITLDMFDPPGAVEWSRGQLFAFRQRDRWIYLGLIIGADASPSTRQQAETLVNSIRVSRSGRC